MENNVQPNMQNTNSKPSEPLNKNLAIICGTIIVLSLIVSATVLYKSNSSGSANSGNNIAGNNNPAQQQQNQVAVDISKVKIDGSPFEGNINAPVVIASWEDYQCPFCKKLETEVIPQLVADYVNTGKVKIVYKDWQFLGADSQTLGQWGRAVWEAAPSKFGAWHKAMFDNQGQENTGWATHDKILSITTNAIGSADANKADQLVKSKGGQYLQAMAADKAEGTSFGINGTPGVVIGKQLVVGAQPYSAFKIIIDEQLKNLGK